MTNPSVPADPRLIAHHVGARGFGVSFNVPESFRRDVVHVLYEADAEAVERMLRDTGDAMAQALAEKHVLPYALGRRHGKAMLNVTANSYASSILAPDPTFFRYYCEIPIDAAIYDVTYRDMLEVLKQVEVEVHSIDELFAARKVPVPAPPDFLSLDTQGYELEILEGARDTLRAGVLGAVCEIEMIPMYSGQPLLADILNFMTAEGFLFAGFTAFFEVSPRRAPVGLRGKGFPAFGDALFLRDLEKLPLERLGADRAYAMLLKAAFIALCFGHVEYSLDALHRAANLRSRVDPSWRARLEALGYAAFLRNLAAVAERQPSMYPPIHAVPDNSRQPGDRRTSWYDKHHSRALKMISAAAPAAPAVASPQPAQGSGLLQSPLARVAKRLLPAWVKARLRRLLIRDRPAVVAEAPPALAATAATVPAAQWPPMQNYTEFEKLLDGAGFAAVTDIVRQRRAIAERYIRVLDRTMYRDGASAHLARE